MGAIDRALKDAGTGQNHALGPQPRRRLLHPVIDVELVRDLVANPLLKPALRLGIKRLPSQIRRNLALVVALGIVPASPRQCGPWGEVKLSTEIAENARRYVRIATQKPAELA